MPSLDLLIPTLRIDGVVIMIQNEHQNKIAQTKMLGLFLDLIIEDTITNPQNIEVYTEEMADEDKELLDGVAID
jgi:hypothetical protein